MAITNTSFASRLTSLITSFSDADRLEYSKAIVSDIHVDNEIEKEKPVLYGFQDGDVVPIIENNDSYTMFPSADETVCSTSECDIPLNFSGVKLTMALAKCRIPICLNSFNKDFLYFWGTYRKFNENPDLDEALLQFIGKQFKQGLENAKWRRAYFADKLSTSNLLDKANGFFTQADAGATAGVNEVTIAKNSGANYAAQIMTGQEVYELLSEMYDLASVNPWFDPATYQFEVTWQMANVFVNWLNNLGHKAPANCSCYNAEGIVKSNVYTVDNVAFNGVRVIGRKAFDGVISQVPELNGNNVAGAARTEPNRAILAKNENMPVFSTDEENLTFFDIWHSKDDEKIYMRGGTYIGAAIPEVNKIIYAH